jgi:DNA-binding winged helix-turn-helix (wHTH) protein/predicted negative regulator of RcsB-dependent stress response
MDSKTEKNLEEAKSLFYSLRLVESYNILRRFFDRLPFKPEPEHAEHMGMFVRTLVELGKEYELKFYLSEIERLYGKLKSPQLAFQLAIVYLHMNDPKIESAKRMIDAVLRDPTASALHAKAKLFLVVCYDREEDLDGCRGILDSITNVQDPALEQLVNIWKAKILVYEKKTEEAEALLKNILEKLSPKEDWYPYTSARLLLAEIYVNEKKMDAARVIRSEVRKVFDGKHFRSVQLQLDWLDKLMNASCDSEPLRIQENEGKTLVVYADKVLSLEGRNVTKKLLLLLAEKKFLDKASIVKDVYERQYDGLTDDKLIYYQIHTLRKCLKSIGLPPDAVINEGDGYRLVTEVEILGGIPWVGQASLDTGTG